MRGATTIRLGLPASLLHVCAMRRKQQAIRKFFSIMRPSRRESILDLGGPSWGARELMGYFDDVIVVNVDRDHLLNTRSIYGRPCLSVVGSGCRLPLLDRSVDYVFSWAVIEHIPGAERTRFASEIRRVCRKGFLVTTPNYWFPFEFHAHMPFWQFLPNRARQALLKHFSFGRLTRFGGEVVDLLTSRDLRRLFPEAKVEGLSWTLIAETLMVHWRNG